MYSYSHTHTHTRWLMANIFTGTQHSFLHVYYRVSQPLSLRGGEVNILNSSYTQTRYGFAYAWWSAHNAKKYAEKDKEAGTAPRLRLF
jgi:hypothetical protein